MSITRIQGTQINSAGTGTSQAITVTAVTLGHLLVASVACGSNNTTITGPARWTQATINQPAGASATIETSIWYLVVGASDAGATSFTWTFSASHSMYICFEEWSASGGWPGSPLDVVAQGDTAGTPVTATTIVSGTTATTAQAEELWIAALAYKGSAQAETSITSGWTKDVEATLAANNTLTMLYNIASSTGTAACQYTIGTGQFWAGSVATFKDSSGVALSLTTHGVGTLAGAFSLKTALSLTTHGVGTLAGALSLPRIALSASVHGTSTLTATLSVPIPSHTIVDLHVQKTQLVQVFDPYGNFLAVWPDAPHISGLKDTVNCAQGQIKLVLPRPIGSYDAPGQALSNGSVAVMNQVKIFVFGPGLPATGLLKFNGFIDTIEAAVTDTQQQSVTVTLTPWSATFGDHGYGGSLQFNAIDPIQLFKYWFNTTDPLTGVKYTDPLTWDPGNPSSSGKTVNYLIQALDLKSIGDTTITMLGSGWFWRPNPSNTVTIGQVPATAQHTFQLGKHFASMSYSIDNTQRKNVIYFTGASTSYGTLHTALTANTSTTIVATGAAFAPFLVPASIPVYLVIVDPVNGNETVTCSLPATGTGPYTFTIAASYNSGKIRVAHAGADALTIQVLIKATAVGASALPPSLGGIGERLLQVQDSRITDNGSAQIVASALLGVYDAPQIRAKFRVVDYRGNASFALGFDIETLKVGDSITILDSRGHTFPSTWGNFTWGESAWGQSEGAVFNQIIPIASLDYNWTYVDVEAGILAPSQDRQLFQLQRRFRDFTLGV